MNAYEQREVEWRRPHNAILIALHSRICAVIAKAAATVKNYLHRTLARSPRCTHQQVERFCARHLIAVLTRIVHSTNNKLAAAGAWEARDLVGHPELLAETGANKCTCENKCEREFFRLEMTLFLVQYCVTFSWGFSHKARQYWSNQPRIHKQISAQNYFNLVFGNIEDLIFHL